MPVPSPRNKILPARGTYATLAANVASLLDGEICYAVDQDQHYQNEGGTLVAVGATKAQGILADSATQPGDNVSTLTNDAGYITSAGAPVQSVNSQTGAVVLDADDIDDTSTTNKFATAAELSLIGSATQPGDNISTLTNDSGYITSAGAPVQSVAGKTGVVTLVKGDVGLGNVDNTSDLNKPISTATQTALDLKAPLASPTLTGVPTAPTATVGTNTTQLATTAFVVAELAAGGGGAVDSVNGQTGTVVLDPDDLDDSATTNKFVTYGTYTPTGTIVTNLATLTTKSSTVYLRFGNTVWVEGYLTMDPTSSGTVTFRLSLPISSNLSSGFAGLRGWAFDSTTPSAGDDNLSVYIRADTINDEANFTLYPQTSLSRDVGFFFSYVVA